MYQQNPFINYKIYKTNTLNDKNCFRINKNVKILTFVPETNPEELNFVNKVMNALQWDDTYIQIHSIGKDERLTIIEEIPEDQSLFILLMGVSPGQLGLNVAPEPYSIRRFSNVTLAFTPGPKSVMNSKEEKSHLWNLIKKGVLHEG